MQNLSPVERGIVTDLRIRGDNVPANIADNTGYHQKSVCRSVANLEDLKLVRNKGRGVWTLTHRGQEVADELIDEPPPKQERIN